MSEAKVSKAIGKLPKGITGFCAGFVCGYMTDKVSMYIYLNFVPEKDRPVLPIFAPDDWVVFGICVLLAIKNPEFGMGMFVGALLSSGALW